MSKKLTKIIIAIIFSIFFGGCIFLIIFGLTLYINELDENPLDIKPGDNIMYISNSGNYDPFIESDTIYYKTIKIKNNWGLMVNEKTNDTLHLNLHLLNNVAYYYINLNKK